MSPSATDREGEMEYQCMPVQKHVLFIMGKANMFIKFADAAEKESQALKVRINCKHTKAVNVVRCVMLQIVCDVIKESKQKLHTYNICFF